MNETSPKQANNFEFFNLIDLRTSSSNNDDNDGSTMNKRIRNKRTQPYLLCILFYNVQLTTARIGSCVPTNQPSNQSIS